jgi:hypothetical protein
MDAICKCVGKSDDIVPAVILRNIHGLLPVPMSCSTPLSCERIAFNNSENLDGGQKPNKIAAIS